MLLIKEGIKPVKREEDRRPTVDDLSPRPTWGNCQLKNNYFLNALKPMRVIAKYIQVEQLEHYGVIKPKNLKTEIDEEDPKDDDNEDYENEEDWPGFESEPDYPDEDIEQVEDGRDKSWSAINKEKFNTRKREFYYTLMVYLKNQMDENYEMD